MRGNAQRLQSATAREIILSGATRTGKSLAVLYKLHTLALQYSGMRGLIIRKTRESLNESGLLTFERDVLGEDSPLLTGARRNSRQSYRYPNGSEIVVAGILSNGKDQRAKIMSTEYDIIFVQEAIELLEDEWQKLTTRLSNYRVPYQQILGDCNPDAPTHWIWRRANSKKLQLWDTFHKDNPRWWALDPSSPEGGQWTTQGQELLAALGNLTGVTRERLFEGKWVQASGLVYGDVWSDGPSDGNVTETADFTAGSGEIFWAVDDGYAGEYNSELGQYQTGSHPRVFLLAQERRDGTLCVFEENYAVQRLADTHLTEILALPYPRPEYAAVDKSAAELRGRIHSAGIHTMAGPADVEESIKTLRDFLGQDKNKRRRLLVHPRCRLLRAEMASYKREEHTGKIIKDFDHGPDALRYLAWTKRYQS